MPIRSDVDDMIAFLNATLALDPDAVTALVVARVPCNAEVATYLHIQANSRARRRADGTEMGLLGTLNGFFGTYADGPWKGYGAIMAQLSAGRVLRFVRTDLSGQNPPAGA